MRLDLSKVFKNIHPTTIKKGRDYYERNLVQYLNYKIEEKSVSTNKNNNRTIEKIDIYGQSNGYDCELTINDNELTYFRCNCYIGTQYDNLVCKHIVSLIYQYDLKTTETLETLCGINIKDYLKEYSINELELISKLLESLQSNKQIITLRIYYVDAIDLQYDFLIPYYVSNKNIERTLALITQIIKNHNEDNKSLLFLAEKLSRLNNFIIDGTVMKSHLLAYLKNQDDLFRKVVNLYIDDLLIDSDLIHCNEHIKMEFQIKKIIDNNKDNYDASTVRCHVKIICDYKIVNLFNEKNNKVVAICKKDDKFYYFISTVNHKEFSNEYLLNSASSLFAYIWSNKNDHFLIRDLLPIFSVVKNIDFIDSNIESAIRSEFIEPTTISFDLDENDQFCVTVDVSQKKYAHFWTDIIRNYLFQARIKTDIDNCIHYQKSKNQVKAILPTLNNFLSFQYLLINEIADYCLPDDYIKIKINDVINGEYKLSKNDKIEIIKNKLDEFHIVYKKDNNEINNELLSKILNITDIKKNEPKFFRYKNKTYCSNDFINIIKFAKKTQHFNVADNHNKSNIQQMFYFSTLLPKQNVIKFLDWYENYKVELDVDKELFNILKPYQVDGVYWLKKMLTLVGGCILADEMGLGKTIQSIAYINDYTKSCKLPILIICPSTVSFIWMQEFKKSVNLDINLIDGSINERKNMINNIEEGQIYLTSYHKLLTDLDFYKDIEFGLIILDEGQYIKNKNSKWSKNIKLLNSKQRLILSGTPIENNLTEIWSLFDFVLTNYLPNITQFKQLFRNNLEELALIIKPFILQRKKEDELKQLPSKIKNDIFFELEESQMNAYLSLFGIVKKSVSDYVNYNKNDTQANEMRLNALALISKLRMFVCDTKLAGYYNVPTTKKTKCLNLVQELLSTSKDNKIVIFSNFKSALDSLAQLFEEHNIKTFSMTGDTSKPNRIKIIEAFKESNEHVLLVSLKVGGVGINLNFANIVIHYNPWWNDSAENQATDRLHRIGQEREVKIYNLIALNTIEEYILEIKEAKNEMISKTLDSRNYKELFNKILATKIPEDCKSRNNENSKSSNPKYN